MHTEREYVIRRKIFTLLGAKFHVYDRNDRLIGYSQQKAFKLKEDLRIFTDESKSQELLSINARSVIDFGAAYDVTDSATGRKIGALRRKGFTSILRDAWMVLDGNDHQVGAISEDSAALAVVRRFMPMGNMIPQTFHLSDASGQAFAEYKTHFNPFVHKMSVTVFDNCPIDPHVVLASGILLVAIEGRQQG